MTEVLSRWQWASRRMVTRRTNSMHSPPSVHEVPADLTPSHLMNHLYEYFGILLDCSAYSSSKSTPYNGAISMYNVHKFMALDPYDFGFFVQQVALSAASYGVAVADLQYVETALNDLFGHKCSAQDSFVDGWQPRLQSICITVSH